MAKLVLATALLGLLISPSHLTERTRAQSNDCQAQVVVVTVVDPQEAAVAAARLELRRVPDSEAGSPKPLAVVTDDNGVGRFAGLPCGTYDLVSTASGFPSKRLRVDVTDPGQPTAIRLTLGIPCEGEPGPAITLTDQDRATILGDLLDRTSEYTDLTVLLDEHIESLRRLRSIPDRLTVLSRKALLRRSRGGAITYISVQVREIKGSCVVAGYSISCAEDGHFCNMCCEDRTFIYRRVDGHWEGTYFWGAII